MQRERQVFIFLGIFALVSLIIVPNVFFPVEQFSPIRSLRKVIDFYQRLEALQQELTTLLKKDPFQGLIQNDIEPVENLIAKESHEIQMYLREFSLADLIVIKDFEESLQYAAKRLKTIPIHVQSAMNKKQKMRSELMTKKLQIQQDHTSFKAEIENLETVGIYLNLQDSKGRITQTDYADESYDDESTLEILKKILQYFETLDKLQDKIRVLGRHSSFISAADSASSVKGEQVSTIIKQKEKAEKELVETIYRRRGILRNVYTNSETLLNRIQEYFSVLEHKDEFWNNEWEERRDHLQKQFETFTSLLNDLKDNSRLRTEAGKEFSRDL